jgi:drug efflux transport system ATP-binding protein
MDAIRAAGLTRRFGQLTAVDRLDLAVAEGEIFGLVGPDGAGKTTTLRMLASILDPTAGDGWVAGKHIAREAEAVKAEIGYMSQRFGLYPDLTVAENIHFYADLYGVPRRGREEKIERLLGFSGLTPFRRRYARNLSGGMKQKLGLSCALIHTPRVLLLDEPTNGVDPVSRRDFWRILYQLLREKVTILVSTAYLDEAERCGRIGLLDHGRLLALGTPREVKGLLQGAILEVVTVDPRAALARIREALPASPASLFGRAIHLVTGDPEGDTGRVRDLLAAAGVAMEGIRRIEPTIEDVFVSVVAAGVPPSVPPSGRTPGGAHAA